MVKEQLIQIDFSEEMKTSYRDYAVSVIISRALPDVRDGLKPVQRRILYAMNELGLAPDKPHRKSARIVGDTMGKYHPHGDSSIYDALVHMTEDFSLSVPLVDGHGNFGSVDGDSAAAMRYTEARLSKGAMTMIEKLSKNLVEFVPNFDESEKEPVVLPAMLPNLLINGTTGIAVGMATNIPPHNPGEVIDGVIALMDKPDMELSRLMKYIPGPDFPTGGVIINSSELYGIYQSGEGKIKLRGTWEIEKSDSGRKNIVITEIPYTAAGGKGKLVENLSGLMKNRVFEEIYDVRDESSKEGIRIVVEVKRDRDIDNLLNGLYKKSGLEDTYGVNMLAVKKQQPICFDLISMLKEFIAFQEELYIREYKYLLEKAAERQEIVEGLLKATDVIDLIIEILRGSDSVAQAKSCLTNGETKGIRFKSGESKKQAAALDFTLRQAEAILAMPLGRLIGLEILKLNKENEELSAKISEYKKVLGDKQELYKVIKKQLQAYKKEFAHPRRTRLCDVQRTEYVEEVKVENLMILIDRFGYVKAVDQAAVQRAGEETLSEYRFLIPIRSDDKLCCFTREGNLYQLKASSLPKCRLKEKGTLIQNLCRLDKEEIVFYTSFEELFEGQLLFTTRQGYIKMVSGAEFETKRSLMAATKLENGDTLCTLKLLSSADIFAGDRKVILLTKKGLSLGFPLEEVSELKKTSRGVKGITLEKEDELVFAEVVPQEQETFEFEGKSLSAKKVRLRRRAAKGQKAQL